MTIFGYKTKLRKMFTTFDLKTKTKPFELACSSKDRPKLKYFLQSCKPTYN